MIVSYLMIKKIQKSGFTLIELLVVVLIMIFLALIILIALENTKNKGRDAKITSDMVMMRKKLDLDADINTNVRPAIQDICNNGYALINDVNPLVAAEIRTLANDITDNQRAITGASIPYIPAYNGGGASCPGSHTTSYQADGLNIVVPATGLPYSYAIYARITSGYVCIDSTGKTVNSTDVIPESANAIVGGRAVCLP